MAAQGELNFILKMQDQGSSAMNQFGSSLSAVSQLLQSQIGVMQELTAALTRHGQSASTAASASKDHAEAVDKEGEAAEHAAEGHKKAAEAAEEHEAGLSGLVSKTKEAAEAFAAMWAMSELNEKTIGSWSEMEVALLRIKTVTNASKGEMKEFQETIEGLASTSLNQTGEQLAAVAKSAGELGLSGEKLISFATNVSKLATATGMSVESVTEGMGEILSATGEVADGAQRFGDVFDTMAKRTRGGAQGLMETANILAQMTAGMGMSSQQTLGFASALSNLGLRSHTAAQSVGEVFVMFQKLSTDDRLDGQLRQMATAIGMTSAQFKEMEKTDPAGLFNRFVAALSGFEKAGGESKEFLRQFNLDGQMTEKTLDALVKRFGDFKAAQEAAAGAKAGSANKDADDFADTLIGQMHRAQQAVTQFGETLGEAVSPEVKVALSALGATLEFVKNGFDALGPVTKAVIGALVIGAPILLAAGTAWKFLSEVVMTGVGVYKNMGGVLGELVKAVTAAKAAEQGLLAAEEKTAAAAKTATTALAEKAAVEREAGAASTVAAEETSAAAVVTEEAAVKSAAAATTIGARWAALRTTTGVALAGMMFDLGSFIALFNSIEKTVGQQSQLGKAGVSWRDEAEALGHSLGLVSTKDRDAYFQQRKQSGEFKPEKLDLGKQEGEESKNEGAVVEGEKKSPGEAQKGRSEGDKTDAGAMNQMATLYAGRLKDMNDLIAKRRELNTELEDSLALEKVPDGVLETLGLTRQQVEIESQLLKLRELELDPLNKQKEAWAGRLAQAMAYTKAQQEAVAIEQKVIEARKEAIRAGQDPDKAEHATRTNETAINTAQRQKSFVDDTKTFSNQLAQAAALTQTEKDRLQVEQQIQALVKDKGYGPEVEQLQKILELTKQIERENEQFKSLNPQANALQNYQEQLQTLQQRRPQIGEDEYNREKTKLDQDTLAARNPVGAIVQSQQDEIAQLQVMGKYREADLKTLEEITKLKRDGVISDDASGRAIEGQIGANNRMIQDIKDMQGELNSLTESFGSGLSTAIGQALNRQKYAFDKFFASMGQKMMDMAFTNIAKSLEPSMNGMLGGLFGQATTGAKALGGLAKSQMEKTVTTASMQITASNVIVQGASMTAGLANTAGVSTGAGAAGTVAAASPFVPAVPATGGASSDLAKGLEALGKQREVTEGGAPPAQVTAPATAPAIVPAVQPPTLGDPYGVVGNGRGSFWAQNHNQVTNANMFGDQATGDALRQYRLDHPESDLGAAPKAPVTPPAFDQTGGASPFGDLKGVTGMFGKGAGGVGAPTLNPYGTLDPNALKTNLFGQTGTAPAVPTIPAVTAGGVPGASGAINLSAHDIDSIAKVANTEVAPQLAKLNPAQYDLQRQGVVDTLLNRDKTGEYGVGIDNIANRPWQFTQITRNGGLANTPEPTAAFKKSIEQDIASRASGARHDVTGGGQSYLNPTFADKSNLDAWGNHVVAQGRGYGQGDMTQYYGVAPGDKAVAPFNINTPGSTVPQAPAAATVAGANANGSYINGNWVPKWANQDPNIWKPNGGGVVDSDHLPAQFKGAAVGPGSGAGHSWADVQKDNAQGAEWLRSQEGAIKTPTSGVSSVNDLQSTAMKNLQTQSADMLKKQADQLTETQKAMTAQLSDTGKQFEQSFQGMGGSITGVGDKALGAVPDMSQFSSSISKMVQSLGSSSGGLGGLGGLFGGGGGSGDFTAFHSGGVVGSTFGSSLTRRVSPTVFIGAPRFHDGLSDDEFPAILQRGERVLTQAQDQRNAATMSRLADAVANQSTQAGTEKPGVGARARPINFNMNVSTPNANSFRYSQSQIMASAHAAMSRSAVRHN